MAARASRLEWALRFSGASDTDSAMIVKDFKSLSDIACADTFDYLKAGETWQDLSSRAQAVETRFSVEAGVPTSKGGIILVQTLSNAELKYEDECQRPGLGELMQMTDGDFAAAMSKEQSDECTTIDTGEEDVQNSVETRGSPELVVYAAWAWAGGGGDSLPSWSSNFGKCR